MKKSIEDIEKSFWGEPPEDVTNLMAKVYSLRRKKLEEFTNEDLRLGIGQNIRLEILIPMALQVLNDNLFAEGDLYEGDLLHNVLTSDKSFWLKNEKIRFEIVQLITGNSEAMEKLYGSNEMRRLRKAFEAFKTK